MVAIINTSNSIRRSFLYNENKLKEGTATCLMAKNYPMDLEYMTESHRLNMLLRTAEKNPDVKRNSVHISLNFAPDEHIDDDRMRAIATEYMEQIGFGRQPYLLYRHFDAAHPHVHLVTTKIRQDATKIDMQHIGKLLSEPARKLLETKYNLVKAEDHKRHVFKLEPVDVGKVQYGKMDTKRAIGIILSKVIPQYKFTTIGELNAVLSLYNVGVDKGAKGSRVDRFRGLNYHLIDSLGKRIGVPIKASLFHEMPDKKPILKNLEKLFLRNDIDRLPHKSRITSAIDYAIKVYKPKLLDELAQLLLKQGVRLVPQKNDQGQTYGLTYIDLKNRVVYNGSSLGKNYSAKAILERLDLPEIKETNGIKAARKLVDMTPAVLSKPLQNDIPSVLKPPNSLQDKSLLELLLQSEYTGQAVPFEWKKKKRKKKR